MKMADTSFIESTNDVIESETESFFFIFFTTTLIVLTISVICLLIYLTIDRNEKLEGGESAQKLPGTGKHFVFQDEENTDFCEKTTKDVIND